MPIKLNSFRLLRKTQIRDTLIFAVYSVLITALFQFSIYTWMKWDFSRVTLAILMIGQFYLTAYIKFPVNNFLLRKLVYLIFHVANFIVFREIVLAFSPSFVESKQYFDLILVVFFLLIVLGRDIRLYSTLSVQLHNLERWSERRILFDKPAKIKVHLGESGLQNIHPNEILYVRTKSAGDHTKIFGIKSRDTKQLEEYETTFYKNFDEVGKILIPFPQFKRISQSTVINYKYPFDEKNGTVIIEGRRFRTMEQFQ